MRILAYKPIWGLILALGVAAEHSSHDLTVFKVEDTDFENTKIRKPCLIAQLNATINITHTVGEHKYVHLIPIPQYASTRGSTCNFEYTSTLQLHFHLDSLTMTFFRKSKPFSVPKKTTYCDKCDYGTWNMTQLKAIVHIEEDYKIQAAMVPETLNRYAKELAEGIDIKRAFKCEEADRVTDIPLRIEEVLNATSHEELSPEYWSGKIVIYTIQVQPFLVLNPDHFNDPYLCRDITVSLLLIILLPLFYFFIYIMYYRIKSEYGCPPNCSGPQKEKLSSSMESDTCMEEESTNIMSGFNGIPIDFNSTSATTYC